MRWQRIRVLLSSETSSSELSIASVAFALPEFALASTGGVSVIGGGTEGFLLFVVADETEFNEDREQEEYAVPN